MFYLAKVKIISDSSCDLSKELIAKYDIETLPFFIDLGGKTYKDGVDITPPDIYDFVAKSGTLPQTAAVSVETYQKAFSLWRVKGYEIVCMTISSDMSSSCQNARMAAQAMDGVYVVDSRNLSTGVGHVVINAAIMAKSGLPAKDIAEKLAEIIPKVHSSFILDNLAYMEKGGRCSSVAVLGANLLRIKPMIEVVDGVMKVGRKFRGPLKKVLENYVDVQLEHADSIRSDLLFITHTGCAQNIVDAVRARVEQHVAFNHIEETVAGATITSHSGPNTLGILYVLK